MWVIVLVSELELKLGHKQEVEDLSLPLSMKCRTLMDPRQDLYPLGQV